MGFMDELKRLARPYAEEDDDELEDYNPPAKPASRQSRERSLNREAAAAPRERSVSSPLAGATAQPSSGRGYASGDKVVNIHATTQVQVVLRKPERFEEASEIADNLREKRTVVLNLESTNKDVARRLVDFLSGVAYALDGKIKKVAVSTYIITPYNVEILGDILDELESNGLYI